MIDSLTKAKVLQISKMKYILPADRVILKLSKYHSFGKKSNLRLDPQYIPHLKEEPTVTVRMNFSAVTFKLDSTTSVTAS